MRVSAMALHRPTVALRCIFLLQTSVLRSASAVPNCCYSSVKKKKMKEELKKLPGPYGRRIREVAPGGVTKVSEAVEEDDFQEDDFQEDTTQKENDDSSAVHGDTFPDPPSSHENISVFYDPLALKFINMLMKDGKKSQASKVFAQALGVIKKTQLAKADKLGSGDKIVLDPMVIFYQAVENVKPSVTTQVIKKGGRGYHVPCSITAHRRTFLACKWIIESVRRKDRGLGTAKKLAIDFIDSYNHEGAAIKKKQDLHRLADANRAYAHFRW